jgi:hypothetical protein
MTPVHDTRNTAQAISPHEAVAQPLNERTADCANVIAEHLEKFGVPKSRRGARHHVVLSRPSRPTSGGAERRIENLAPDEWRPRYPATRAMTERAPAAMALMGYDPIGIHTRAHWSTGSAYDWRSQR